MVQLMVKLFFGNSKSVVPGKLTSSGEGYYLFRVFRYYTIGDVCTDKKNPGSPVRSGPRQVRERMFGTRVMLLDRPLRDNNITC